MLIVVKISFSLRHYSPKSFFYEKTLLFKNHGSCHFINLRNYGL